MSKILVKTSQRLVKENKMTDDRSEDATYENESTRDTTPMVRISIREYDALRDQAKEAGKYITDPSLISIIDKIEELTRALRKHIVRKY